MVCMGYYIVQSATAHNSYHTHSFRRNCPVEGMTAGRDLALQQTCFSPCRISESHCHLPLRSPLLHFQNAPGGHSFLDLAHRHWLFPEQKKVVAVFVQNPTPRVIGNSVIQEVFGVLSDSLQEPSHRCM